MGGRGSSSGKNGIGYTATKIIGQGGAEIDLTDTPLRYTGNDAAITGKAREVLEAQEKKRLEAAVEYAYGVDADGNVIGEKRGGKASCAVPYNLWVDGGTLTHNHPRTGDEKGTLGGTFSTADIKGLVAYDVRTMRASAAEGTYSITKSKNFNGNGLISYRRQLERSANAAAKQKVQEAGERYKRGEISQTQLMSVAKKASNAALVSIHNGLIAGQSTYGYTYTLERRA